MLSYLIHGGSFADRTRYIATRFLKNAARHTIITLSGENASTIGIGEVRALHRQLGLKQTSTQYVIIDQAEKLTLPAQNSLLKILEEPAEKTQFILAAPTKTMLLPTIRSRLVGVPIRSSPPDQMTSGLSSITQSLKNPYQIAKEWEGQLDTILPSLLSSAREDLIARVQAGKGGGSTITAIRRIMEAIQDHRQHVNKHLNATALALDLRRILQVNG